MTFIKKENFTKKIMKSMDEKDVKGSALAKELGKKPSCISNYIYGRRLPDVDTFLLMCQRLKISPEYFFDSVSVDEYCNYIIRENKGNETKSSRERMIDEVLNYVELYLKECTLPKLSRLLDFMKCDVKQ